MTGSKNSEEHENTTPDVRDSGDESEDESEVLEESPCGRWQKRREEVTQRDVPGIDCAFLAMDTEEGVEVVWNEVSLSVKKASKTQLEKIKQVFDNLIQLDHVNIVKFHNYWTDTKTDNRRVIFITEYMSSGSLKQFLKKTKKNNKTIKAWKRWCTQILSALSYLHSCTPPIIHGNLTTDTIFIQHNGLIKIGSVAPDAIYNHVKTYKQEQRNMHYIAPEYAGMEPVSTAVDIYSFGICALEMAALEIPGNGDTGQKVTEESIQNTLKSLEDPLQRDFITRCLEPEKSERPTARELLFHAVLFEVHSLKLLAAHTFVKHASVLPESETYQPNIEPSQVVAEIIRTDGRDSQQFTVGEVLEKTYGKGQFSLEIEKFLEDVRNGVYPLTAFASIIKPPESVPRSVTPELAESVKSETPEPADIETRKIVSMTCELRKQEESNIYLLTILLRMDDKMNRQLTGELSEGDTAQDLASELVTHCLINPEDKEKIASLIEESLISSFAQVNTSSPPASQLIANGAS